MVAKVPYQTQQAILAERAKGRTDRQIEKILGLQHGLLSRPYVVDVRIQAETVAMGRDHAAWQKREKRRWAALVRSDDSAPVHGWRPKHDLVKSRPDAKPLRQVPKRPRKDDN
jgi:hypothetical protein